MVRTSKVLKDFDTWVVTEFGVECKTEPYQIHYTQLYQNDWEEHMKSKSWVDFDDFFNAYEYARKNMKIWYKR